MISHPSKKFQGGQYMPNLIPCQFIYPRYNRGLKFRNPFICKHMRIEYRIAAMLVRKRKTLSVAESCSGGLLADTLTDISGSSIFFRLGIVAYDNAAKIKLLKIPAKTLASNGAVSAAIARLMAQNVRKILKTDLGVGITGIAGPSGGTKTKPVGLTYVAVSDGKTTHTKEFRFKGTREANKVSATYAGLRLLLNLLDK